MKTIDELLNLKSEINTKVDDVWKNLGADKFLKPAYDGIVNEEEYIKSKYKILWILKEAYCDPKDEKGNPINDTCWDYTQDLNDCPLGYAKKVKTIQEVIYASYGMLNGFKKYNTMNYYYDENMYEILRSIAIINIKKIPGVTSSNGKVISSYYAHFKNILLKQIKEYEPNIIIGGSTLSYFWTDLELDKLEKNEFVLPDGIDEKFTNHHFFDSKRIFIDAYHPSYYKSNEKKKNYCDVIVSIAKNWAEKYNRS